MLWCSSRIHQSLIYTILVRFHPLVRVEAERDQFNAWTNIEDMEIVDMPDRNVRLDMISITGRRWGDTCPIFVGQHPHSSTQFPTLTNPIARCGSPSLKRVWAIRWASYIQDRAPSMVLCIIRGARIILSFNYNSWTTKLLSDSAATDLRKFLSTERTHSAMIETEYSRILFQNWRLVRSDWADWRDGEMVRWEDLITFWEWG